MTTDPASRERDHRRLLADGREAFTTGRLGAARLSYRRAVDAAREAGDGEALAEAVLGLGGLWVNEQRSPDEWAAYRALLEQAITATSDPVLAARLRLRAAVDARYAADGSQDEVRAALDELRRFDDPEALAGGLSLVVHTLLAPQDAAERAVVLDELVATAARAGDPHLVLVGLMWTALDAFFEGRSDAVRALQRLRVRADELGNGVIRYVASTVEVMLLLRAGRLEEVEALIDDLLRFGLEVGERDARVIYGGQILAVRWYQGRGGEIQPAMNELADSPALTRFNRAYLATAAALAAEVGEDDDARVALARVAAFDGPPDGLEPSSVWIGTMFMVVEAIRRLGDEAAAAQAYDALLPYAHLPMMASIAVTCGGSTHRALGLCAGTMGRRDLAIEHLDRAIADNLRFGHRPMLAVTRADLAAELMARGEPDDDRAAAALLDQALEAADDLGMTGSAARWLRSRPGAGGPGAGTDEGELVRKGDVSEISAGSRRALVRHSVGMSMLAALLAAPRQDVTVGQLTGAPAEGSHQPVLDDQARRQVRRRLHELQADIDEADADADIGRASKLRAELDHLVDEVTRMTRPGGGSRAFADASERARTSVQKAIRRTLDGIRKQAPDLADGLRASLHTGSTCRFDPAPGVPQRWTARAGGATD